jgi:hypothetical protein
MGLGRRGKHEKKKIFLARQANITFRLPVPLRTHPSTSSPIPLGTQLLGLIVMLVPRVHSLYNGSKPSLINFTMLAESIEFFVDTYKRSIILL